MIALSALLLYVSATATAQTEPPPRAGPVPCPEPMDPSSCSDEFDPVICGPESCKYKNQCKATAAGFTANDCEICPGGPCPPPCPTCPPTEEKGKLASRRRLLTSNARSLQQEDEAYLSYLSACGDHEYDVLLYVDPETHLYVVGKPKNNDYSATSVASLSCPFGAAHAVRSGKAKTTKEILVWKDPKVGSSMLEEEAQLHIGTFKLSDMALAYEAADPGNMSGSSFYDVVTNNCGAFLVNLASELDIKINSHIRSFVVRRLLENSGKQLADKIRSSLNYFSLFGDRNLRGNEATNEEILRLLVDKVVN